jgi:amino acid permease
MKETRQEMRKTKWVLLALMVLVSVAWSALAFAVEQATPQPAFDWWGFFLAAAPFAFNAITNIASFYAGQKNQAKATRPTIDKISEGLSIASQAVTAALTLAQMVQEAQKPRVSGAQPPVVNLPGEDI